MRRNEFRQTDRIGFISYREADEQAVEVKIWQKIQ